MFETKMLGLADGKCLKLVRKNSMKVRSSKFHSFLPWWMQV